MLDANSLLAFHEGRRARELGQSGSPPEPWRWFPLSCDWIRGWNEADAEILFLRRSKKQRQEILDAR
jgi:hypothetical protein